MPLSDATIRAAKKSDKLQKLSDGQGLQLHISTAGGKLWRLAYRFDGKQKTLAFGRYPAVTLSDARDRRDHAKGLLAKGIDPSPQRQQEAQDKKVEENSRFEVVARAWLATKKEALVDSYSSRILARLEDDIFPQIGQLHIDQIEPPTLLRAIRTIEDRGAIELAKRVKNYCGEIFRFAIAEGKAKRDPSSDIRGALKKSKPAKARAALSASDIPDFLKKLAAYDGLVQTRELVRLALLTFVRTQEIRFAKWTEFENLDSNNALWRIPAERMKMRRPHLVPLSPQATSCLKLLKTIAHNSELLAPAEGKHGVVSENTMIYALYRLGYHSRATIHGFRGTASTILNEHGFNRDWIERQLAHVDTNSVRAAYNSAEWLAERRSMMNWWAGYLDNAATTGTSGVSGR